MQTIWHTCFDFFTYFELLMHFGLLNSVTLLLNLLDHWKFTGSVVFSVSLKLQNSYAIMIVLEEYL